MRHEWHGGIRGGKISSVFRFEASLWSYSHFKFLSDVFELGMVNEGGSAFCGILIQAFVPEIQWKTTFPFLECVFELSMVN